MIKQEKEEEKEELDLLLDQDALHHPPFIFQESDSMTSSSPSSPLSSPLPQLKEESSMKPSSSLVHCISMADRAAVTQLIQSVFKVYTVRDKQEQEGLLRQFYSQQVRFEDPVMRVQGWNDYRLQFFSLIQLFKKVQVDWNSPDGYYTKQPGRAGPHSFDIVVNNTQTYEFERASWLAKKTLPAEVQLKVITTLTIRTCPATSDQQEDSKASPQLDGAILAHEDVWPESSAFQSSFYKKWMKNGVGKVTSGFFHRILKW